jgi:hypothetical protein
MIVLDRTRLIDHLNFYFKLLKNKEKLSILLLNIGVLHKYLLLRGNCYYFRCCILADLRPVFGVTKLICSLLTLKQLLASVRAEHFLEAVGGIKRAREAYLAQEIDTDVYVSKLKKTLG